MTEKWAKVFENDLQQGLWSKRNAKEGEIALFDSKEEAQEWVASSGEIDTELFEANYIKLSV